MAVVKAELEQMHATSGTCKHAAPLAEAPAAKFATRSLQTAAVGRAVPPVAIASVAASCNARWVTVAVAVIASATLPPAMAAVTQTEFAGAEPRPPLVARSTEAAPI